MASFKESRRGIIDSTLGENGLRLVGSRLEVTEQPPEPREKPGDDPDEQLVSQVKHRLQIGRPVSADMFLAALSVRERVREEGVDPEVLEILVEEQNRGRRNGPEPTQIQGLTFAPPKNQFPTRQDSFDDESRP